MSYGIVRRGRCAAGSERLVRFAVSVRPAGAETSEDILVRSVGVKDFDSTETFIASREFYKLFEMSDEANPAIG